MNENQTQNTIITTSSLMNKLLKNCECFHYNPEPITSIIDILIENGKITRISEPGKIQSDVQVIDCSGMEVFPGGIDSHVHFSYIQGGKAVSADDFYTGSVAAISGGTTAIMDFVEAKSDQTATQAIQTRSQTAKQQKTLVDYAFHFSICNVDQLLLVDEAAKIEESFKIYTVYNGLKIDSADDIMKVLSKIASVDKIAMIHCENDQVITQNLPNAKSIEQMAMVRPAWNELEATTRVLVIAELVKCSIHIAHVSLPDQVDIISTYQRRYNTKPITCEATGHHFTLTSDLYKNYLQKEQLVMSPPLQSAENVESLKQKLVDNQVSFTVSDHCPFTVAQRNGSFSPFKFDKKVVRKFYEMPGGTNGVQVRFIATYSAVKTAGGSLEQISKQTSQAAADRFKLKGKGRIAVGYDADIVVVDPNQVTTFGKQMMKENCDTTLFEGQQFRGVVSKVFVRGAEYGVDEIDPGRYLRE